jgi:uncharacterized MAPEG superfamily protein
MEKTDIEHENKDVETGNVETRDTETKDAVTKGLSFWQVFMSTVAAAFGVQSSKNRERDFKQGKALHFILMGIIFTILFVLAVVGVVSLVLP